MEILLLIGGGYFLSYTALTMFGWRQHRAGNHERAMWLLDLAIRINPWMTHARISRGAVRLNYYHDYQGCIDDINRVIQQNRKSTMAFNNRGAAYYQLGETDKALKDFDRSIELQPDLLLAHFNRIRVMYERYCDYDTVIDLCEEAFQYHPQDFWLNYILIYSYIEMKDYEGALEACRHIEKNGLNITYVHSLRSLVLQKRYGVKNAIEEIDKALQFASDDTHILRILAEIYAIDFQFEKVVEIFSKLINSAPKSDELYTSRGVYYSRLGEDEKAMTDHNHALAINPYSALAYNNRSCHLAKQGQFEQALKDVNRCIELEPILKIGYGTRGETYFAIGEYEKALADFIKAEELKMNDGFALIGQAISQYKLGNIDEAKSLWEWGIEQEPQIADIEYVIREFDPPQSFVDAVKEVMALT